MKKKVKKATHTPGPWYVERKYEADCTVAIMRDWTRESVVALAVHGPQGWIHAEGACPEMIESNARLIAAAPELLAALQFAVSEWSGFACPVSTESMLRAAIAKAEA